ncbi:MAG: hypothetical protein LIP00_00135 [Parabacteroides sp.]|nr:hypothetical protein [Parabacteroides sp.]
MSFRVSKRTLFFIAGAVWLVAGLNILRIGIVTWQSDSHDWLFKAGEATIVFLLFFIFVFLKLFNKPPTRISRKPKEKTCPFSFFDKKGWIIMIFMVKLGITIRKFHWLPNSFIYVLYTGLSSALIITGFLFLRRGWKEQSGRAEPGPNK